MAYFTINGACCRRIVEQRFCHMWRLTVDYLIWQPVNILNFILQKESYIISCSYCDIQFYITTLINQSQER